MHREGDGRRLPDRLREARRGREVALREEQHGRRQHDQGEKTKSSTGFPAYNDTLGNSFGTAKTVAIRCFLV